MTVTQLLEADLTVDDASLDAAINYIGNLILDGPTEAEPREVRSPDAGSARLPDLHWSPEDQRLYCKIDDAIDSRRERSES